MSYGGESWAKKLSRLEYWQRVLRVVGKGAFGSARFLVISGPDAGDAKCLVGMGVNPSRIVAVDTNADAIASASRFAGPTYIHGDVVEVARDQRGKFDNVFLDLCSTAGPRACDLVARTASFALREGGVVGAGFMYGREGATFMERVRSAAAADAETRARQAATFAAISERYGLSPLAAAVDFFDDDNIHADAELLGGDDVKNARGAAVREAMRAALNKFGWHDLPFGHCFYRSTRIVGGKRTGVPMLYTVHHVLRARGRRFDVNRFPRTLIQTFVCNDDSRGEIVRSLAVGLVHHGGAPSKVVANLLNIPAGRLAAWLAVDTRERKASVA